MSSFYLITNWLHISRGEALQTFCGCTVFASFTAYINFTEQRFFVFTAAAKLRYRTREINGVNAFGYDCTVSFPQLSAAALEMKLAEGFAFMAENSRLRPVRRKPAVTADNDIGL